MCDEKQINVSDTKVCRCCGERLPIDAFARHGNSKDGYSNICKACKAKTGNGNPALAGFSPRELIEELRIRGYRGTLEYVQRHEITL